MNVVILMWSIAATVLAGSFIVVALVVPQIGALLHMSDSLVVIAAVLLGAIVAIPVAVAVARALVGNKKAA